MQKSLIKNEKFWFWIIIIFFLLIRFVLFFYNFTEPPLDHHSFRQTQTLMTARNFYLNGINILLPKLDMFGTPGYSILEFPIYQVMITILYKIFFPAEIFGRILSIVFTLFSALLLWLITKKLFDSKTAIFSAIFFLFSPLILYYSRTIMLEPMEIFLFLCSIYLYFLWIDTNKTYLWILATIQSALFILVKPLYVVIFLPIIFSYRFKKEEILSKKNILLILSFAIQAIFVILWLHHANIINKLFPNNFALTAKSLYECYFGPFLQHLNPNSYFIIIARILSEFTGKAGMILILLSLFEWKKLPAVIKAYVVSFAIYLMIFTNLNLIHDYYQLLIAPLMAIFMAIGFHKILLLITRRKNLFIFLMIFMIAYSNVDAAKIYFENDKTRLERIKYIKKFVPSHSNAIYFGYDLDPNLPHYHYFAETKGVNINLKNKKVQFQDIIIWNEKDNIRYFIFFGDTPNSVANIFKKINGQLIFRLNGKISIYKI